MKLKSIVNGKRGSLEFIRDKRGVLGLNTVNAFMIAILTAAVVAVAVLLTLNSLNQTSIATNATRAIADNVSEGLLAFFANSPTFFVLLGVAVIILIIAVVIFATRTFSGAAPTQGGL